MDTTEDDPLLEIPFQPKTADPSEEEIRQQCKVIQATWSPAIRSLRAGCYARRQVELPWLKSSNTEG
jgi:hypothetical protein